MRKQIVFFIIIPNGASDPILAVRIWNTIYYLQKEMCVFLTETDLELISISKVKFFVGLTLGIVLKEPNVKIRVIKNIKSLVLYVPIWIGFYKLMWK